MSTTSQGIDFENKVYDYFLSLLESDSLCFAPKKYSKIFKHKKYKTDTSRKIEFDVTIETYNPCANDDAWSSLVVIECKSYNRKVDISDFDEFETKLNNVAGSSIKGIFVTTKGFSRHQIEKAKKEHIALVVFSETSQNWIVSRDVNRKSEQVMPILLGENEAGIQPIVYYDGVFGSIVDTLQTMGVQISENNIISIPYCSNEQLLQIASDVYRECSPISNDIAGEVLCKKFPKYKIRFDNHPNGVLGLLSLKGNVLSLSNILINDVHRRNFTIAHEIGHLVLHMPLLYSQVNEILEYDEKSHPVLNDKVLTRMEIQANMFASYLLLPRYQYLAELDKLFKQLRITKSRLFLDHQPCNITDVNFVLGTLSQTFNVSKEMIKMRLLNDGFLEIDNNGPQRLRRIIYG